MGIGCPECYGGMFETATVHRRIAELARGVDQQDRERHLRAADQAEANSRRIMEEMLGGGGHDVPVTEIDAGPRGVPAAESGREAVDS